MTWDTFWLLVGFGLMTGSLTALAAMGFSLTMSVTGVVNFAYGEYMTVAAYLALAFAGIGGVPLIVALALAITCVALFAVLTDLAVFAPISGRGELTVLVTSIGLSMVLQNVVLAIWGSDVRRFDLSASVTRPVEIGPFQFTVLQVLIIALSLVLMMLLGPVLNHTSAGRSMRAMASNPDLAKSSGIAIARVRAMTWLLTGSIAGVAGVFLAMTSQLNPGMGFAQLLIAVAPVILGGAGNLMGAVIASYVLGIAMEVSTGYIDASLKPVVAFGVLVLVLLVRPQGLFTKAAR